MTAKGVDDAGNGGGAALANEVKVEHTLHSAGLHSAGNLESIGILEGADRQNSLYKASCLVVEQSVLLEGAQKAGRRVEAGDVIVGVLEAIGRGERRHSEICAGGAGRVSRALITNEE